MEKDCIAGSFTNNKTIITLIKGVVASEKRKTKNVIQSVTSHIMAQLSLLVKWINLKIWYFDIGITSEDGMFDQFGNHFATFATYFFVVWL